MKTKQSIESINLGLSNPGTLLCVECIHVEAQFHYSDFGSSRSYLCRAQAKTMPNPVTGELEWQGRTLKCSEARRRGAGACGPSGRLFKQRYPWWAKDAHGWPIERINNRPAYIYWLRVLFQNIRKVTG